MSASAIAVLFAAMLLVQGLLSGVAHGTMASAAVDPFNILCIAHEDGPQQTLPDGGPAKAAHDLCATLCQIAAGYTPALPGRSIDILTPVLRAAAEIYVVAKPTPRVVLRSFLAEARAPPSSSA
ncbi:hypothetical protein ASE23_05145 [Rhizobium sp. Root73]|nr:hypothetical protein ASC96_01790 [Rhizobium sp. Root1204]KQY17986.1 hypothetical protein ASD36_05145 [Rhizobium sp. Root1334]KRC13843.1 hypothetical protein ASE23_05145 [Rhizobium sp. Root73]